MLILDLLNKSKEFKLCDLGNSITNQKIQGLGVVVL